MKFQTLNIRGSNIPTPDQYLKCKQTAKKYYCAYVKYTTGKKC